MCEHGIDMSAMSTVRAQHTTAGISTDAPTHICVYLLRMSIGVINKQKICCERHRLLCFFLESSPYTRHIKMQTHHDLYKVAESFTSCADTSGMSSSREAMSSSCSCWLRVRPR